MGVVLPKPRNTLLHAASVGNTSFLKFLTHSGADVNCMDKDGNTALHKAVEKGHFSCVKVLLKSGADVNVLNNNDKSALFVAVHANSMRSIALDPDSNTLHCVQILLKAGAHVNTGFVPECLYTLKPDKNTRQIEVPMLLLAAGQKLDRVKYVDCDLNLSVPNYVKHGNTKQSLKHACRKSIRKYLLEIDPYLNLFVRIDKLGLRESLASYIVHNFSLDIECCEYDCDFW